MMPHTPKPNNSDQLEQVPSGFVSKRQYNVAMQALEQLEGEREHNQKQQRLMRMIALTSMLPPPPVQPSYPDLREATNALRSQNPTQNFLSGLQRAT